MSNDPSNSIGPLPDSFPPGQSGGPGSGGLNGGQTLFGHPAGIFTLFFAEMWERFSFYGMKALLLFYMIKGFLRYGDSTGYAIMGAYTALVYMTPFFGGMIADRLIGSRRAVILGGVLMAAGHLMMTVENNFAFFGALGLLIVGNGFFKPNISTIVGSLYPPGSPKRDGGFTIFYIGINLGAAAAPLLCGYVGENLGWHYGFGLATIGMLIGIAVFVAPSIISQVAMFAVALGAAFNIFITPELVPAASPLQLNLNLTLFAVLVLVGFYALWELGHRELKESELSKWIARSMIVLGAVALAVALVQFRPDNPFSFSVNVFVALALLVAAGVAWVALGRGGLPKEAGAPVDPERMRKPVFGLISGEWLVYLGGFLIVPVFALLVSGFAPLTYDGQPMTLMDQTWIKQMEDSKHGSVQVAGVFLREMSRPAGLILVLCGAIALFYVGFHTTRLSKIPRERMYVVFVLTFFSVLFWAFFEQAISSINNFTDRNVDRVIESGHLTKDDVGKVIKFRLAPEPTETELRNVPLLSQEQLGHVFGDDAVNQIIEQAIRLEAKRLGTPAKQEDVDELVKSATKDKVFTITGLTYIREAVKNEKEYKERKDMEPLPQSVDWMVTEENIGMGVGGSEIPATVFQAVNPIYILLFGMIFSALWTFLGTRGMEPSTPVKFALGLLQLGLGFAAFWYGAQLHDERGMVALSWLLLGYLLITTGELCLSPVGLSMVTKLSPRYLVSTVMGMWFLATAFSEFLAAIIAQFTGVSHGEGPPAIPVPLETVHVYGDVFGTIAITACISALILLVGAPLLTRWMHEGVRVEGEEDRG